MSDRFLPGQDQRLETALADLAIVVAFPPTPSLAAGVIGQIGALPAAHWWSRLAPSGGRSLGRSLALAGIAALLIAGLAGAVGIGTGAIQIRFADGTPLPTPMASLPNRGFGQPTTLADAQTAVPFDVVLPADPSLGDPEGVFLAAVPQGGTVTMAWGARPGYPAGEDGIGLVLTQFRADIGPDTFEKLIAEGTSAQSVVVNGEPGWWIEGGTHAFFYRDASGRMVDTTLRLVTSALIWDEDGLALRVEGAPDLASAMRVAASLD